MSHEITNKYHLQFLKELKKHISKGTEEYQQEREKNYIGTTKFCYCIKTPIKKQIVKAWIKTHPQLLIAEYINLLNSI